MEERKDEIIVEIELERLRPFDGHPFKVEPDAMMLQLTESIRHYGVLTPLIVRPRKEGFYEVISGHRRLHAAKALGFRKVPVVIRVFDDDDAIISMIDSNLQRDLVRPSEKAKAYRMKYDAMQRKQGRKKRGQNGQTDVTVAKERSIQIMAGNWVTVRSRYSGG